MCFYWLAKTDDVQIATNFPPGTWSLQEEFHGQAVKAEQAGGSALEQGCVLGHKMPKCLLCQSILS